MSNPFLLVIAGPNGSGKSTLTEYLRSGGVDFGEYINPDEIALTLDLPPVAKSKQAQSIAEFKRDVCLTKRINFSFETVMSHRSKVDFMYEAIAAGFDVTLFFISTVHPEINLSRVENRVALGGHSVPADRIVARYGRAMRLLHLAAMVAHRTVVFDNSAIAEHPASLRLPASRAGLRPVAEVVRNGSHYNIRVEADVPEWVHEFLLRPLAVVEAQARHDGIEMEIAVHQKHSSL